jgi:hypothetical protein
MNIVVKSRSLRWAVLVAAIVVSVVALMSYQRDPHRRAEKIARMSIPSSARLVASKDEWGGFLGDGQSIFVFEVPMDFASTVFARCGEMNLIKGRIVDSSVHLPQAETYIDMNAQSCYRYDASTTDFRGVILSDRTLVVAYGTL